MVFGMCAYLTQKPLNITSNNIIIINKYPINIKNIRSNKSNIQYQQ